MSIRSALAILATALSAASLFAATTVYVNDFTTRTSPNPIPAYGAWMEARPYPEPNDKKRYYQICCRGAARDGYPTAEWLVTRAATYFTAVETGRPSYDGWFTPSFTADALRLGSGPRRDADDICFSWFYGSNAERDGVVLQSIHNTFTNGLLRIQVDMRGPTEGWVQGNASSYGRVFPVYEKYMDVLAWGGALNDRAVTPGKFGLRCSTTAQYQQRIYPQYYHGSSGTTQLGNNVSGNGVNKTNFWFRFVMTYDLDANTFGGEVYRFIQSQGHPTFDTVPSDATPYQTFSDAAAMTAMSDETGGITGIGIDGHGKFDRDSDPALTNKVLVDNLRLSWKAPDASEFAVFYENDFVTRRYRTVCAKQSLTAAYAPRSATTKSTDMYTYADGNHRTDQRRLTPPLAAPYEATQPIGLDGWRTLPLDDLSLGYAAALLYGGRTDTDMDGNGNVGTGANMMTFANTTAHLALAQPLGVSYSAGKVRMSVDARLPSATTLALLDNGLQRMAIGLGGTALYTAARNDLAANLVAGVGYRRELDETGANPVTNYVPYRVAQSSSATPAYITPDSYVNPEQDWWYRIEVTADIDARTYSATITPLRAIASVTADFTPTLTPIFSVADVPFASATTDVGTFYLHGFGAGAGGPTVHYDNRVCFDNIRVWHQADASSSETLVYSNDFSTRMRTVTATHAAGHLAEQYDRDDGPDHWIRQNGTGDATYWATATVRDNGGNQCLVLGHDAEAGHDVLCANTLGVSLCRRFRVDVDIRPPKGWYAAGRQVIFAMGAPQMGQVETLDTTYDAYRQVAFGFKSLLNNGSNPPEYYCTGMEAFAHVNAEGTPTVSNIWSAASSANGNWYRFSAVVNPPTQTYRVKLSNMGMAHPDIGTMGGTTVVQTGELPFEHGLAAAEGISAFYISTDGAEGPCFGTGVDDRQILVDNIKVVTLPGIIMSVR